MYGGYDDEDEYEYYTPPRRNVGGKEAGILALILGVIAYFFVFGLPDVSGPDPAPPAAAPQVQVPITAECVDQGRSAPGDKQRLKEKTTVWTFLRGNGLSRPQAAGVMGNIQAESGFDPDIVEKATGVGYGLAQWSKDRRVAIERAAREQNVPKSDMCFQLRYLLGELKVRRTDRPEYKQWPTEWEMLIHMPNEVEALVAFHHEFERSKLLRARNPRQAVINARLPLVNEALALFPN